MTNVIYNESTGEVIAIGEAEPGSGESSADIDDSNIMRPITGTVVDSTAAPTETVWDSSLPQESDHQERNDIRDLVEVRKRIERIQDEISGGHIPDRTQNSNVDAVLSEWEDRRDELRSRIG